MARPSLPVPTPMATRIKMATYIYGTNTAVQTMTGETGGGGPGGTSPPGPINFISWVGPGDQYITKMDPFCFCWTVFQQLQ